MKNKRQIEALTTSSKKTGWRVHIPENHPVPSLEACCIRWVEECVSVVVLLQEFPWPESK
jgi:hypothetical protein